MSSDDLWAAYANAQLLLRPYVRKLYVYYIYDIMKVAISTTTETAESNEIQRLFFRKQKISPLSYTTLPSQMSGLVLFAHIKRTPLYTRLHNK